MAVLFEKKEAELAGRKYVASRGPGRKPLPKGKGREKVNGNHAESKMENGSDASHAEVEHDSKERKEETPEA
jgi:hypothetical protein